jgi:transposase
MNRSLNHWCLAAWTGNELLQSTQYGIRFVETEESYTSKASFLDNDSLPTFGKSPEGWQESGQRVKRGMYRTANNWYINADCNGAANILLKSGDNIGIES